MARRDTRDGIVAFAGESGALLDMVCGVHESGEGVGEVETEEAADEVGEGAELRDRHGHDEGEDPVDGAETPPEPLASLGGDRGQAADLLADFDVDGFHAYVEVQD